jgi:hypothetical protein
MRKSRNSISRSPAGERRAAGQPEGGPRRPRDRIRRGLTQSHSASSGPHGLGVDDELPVLPSWPRRFEDHRCYAGLSRMSCATGGGGARISPKASLAWVSHLDRPLSPTIDRAN